MRRADPWRWAALAAAIACAAVALFPLYWIAMTSLLPTSAILSRDPPLLPAPDLLDASAYQGVLLRKPLLRWIGNSMAVTLGTLVLTMTAAALAGYSLSRFRTAAQRAMGFALLASKMMPAALVAIPFFVMFTRAGLFGTKLGLVLANSAAAVPFATWLLKGFFDAIPRELDEAARIDGAGHFRIFWSIILPNVRTPLATLALVTFLFSWNAFLWPLVILHSPRNHVIQLAIAQSVSIAQLPNWGETFAGATIATVPLIVLFLFLQRYFVRGIALTGVKG